MYKDLKQKQVAHVVKEVEEKKRMECRLIEESSHCLKYAFKLDDLPDKNKHVA